MPVVDQYYRWHKAGLSEDKSFKRTKPLNVPEKA
jgi:hypothetical protein